MAELVRDPIDAGARSAALRREDCGAVVQFQGTTRDQHAGRRVLRLEYEAYESMALAALVRLEREACTRFGVAACEIVARLGVVPAGEASVAVTVVSAHRAAAFDACRWTMDEIKAVVPIWKKEHFAEGDAAWVPGTPLG